jgi:acetyl-CoA acetyltransferase
LTHGVVIAGVGYSDLGRNTGRSEGSLAVQAARAALDDAGLTSSDVDGLTAFPDRQGGDEFSGPTLNFVQRSLGIDVRFWMASGNGPAQLSCAISAAAAIECGLADVVLCFRSVVAQPRTKVAAKRTSSVAWNEASFSAPYGAAGSAPKWALVAQRYLYESGTDPALLGSVVVNCRQHAQLNPRAVWHGQPITLDDYFDSPLVAEPLRRLDCDMPVDAAVAVILARADRAHDLRHAAARIEAMSCAPGPAIEHDLMDFARQSSYYIGQELWTKTDLRPADVDVVEPYDGFSFQALQWLEDLGFCPPGEAGAMIAEGRCRIGAELPICTDGGQLGVGRYHGLEKLAQAARQVWGGAGQMQVHGAEVSLACAGGGPRGAAMLLTTFRR